MFEWISLRATAAAPGPFSHDKTIFASFLRRGPWLYLMDSSEFMPTFKAVTVSVPGVEAPADIEGGVFGGHFPARSARSLEPARMLLLLLRLLLQ